MKAYFLVSTVIFFIHIYGNTSICSATKDTLQSKSKREGSEIDLLSYSIPPMNGKPVSIGALMELKAKGIPMMEEEIVAAKKQKSWQQMDSLFQAHYPSLNDPETQFVFEEHMAQIILKDFGLLLNTDKTALERTAFYTELLYKNKGVHAGYLCLALTQLKGYWPKEKIKEYAQVTHNRIKAEIEKRGDSVQQIRENFRENTKALSPQELARAEKVVGGIIKSHDENVYFLKKIEHLMEE